MPLKPVVHQAEGDSIVDAWPPATKGHALERDGRQSRHLREDLSSARLLGMNFEKAEDRSEICQAVYAAPAIRFSLVRYQLE